MNMQDGGNYPFGDSRSTNSHRTDEAKFKSTAVSPNVGEYPWASYTARVNYEGGNVVRSDGSAAWVPAEETSLRVIVASTHRFGF